MKDWIRLHSGRKFHILAPAAKDIHIDDIIWGLSHICRFTGQSSKLFSVAQHCCNVSDALPPDLKREGLLHDGSEALICDLNAPLKHLLPQYIAIERKVEEVIARKWKLKYPFPPMVKEVDLRALAAEQRDLMPGDDWKNSLYSPLELKIKPWTPEKARAEFRKRYKALFP